MRLDAIRALPTVVDPTRWPFQDAPTHESVLRAYQILDKVKYLLAEGVPPKIILELIAEMEGSDQIYVSE